ncbi:MAG: helix-turn-helix transcriptional regulator [Planctomycetales bacterium]
MSRGRIEAMKNIHFENDRGSICIDPAVAFQSASSIVTALMECDDELRAEAVELFKQLDSGELEEDERAATIALLAEILFPNADNAGFPGLDLEEAEAVAREEFPEAREILDRMDREEATFAERLRAVMEEKSVTQKALAERVGVGQPAIAMMLARQCRPQQRTVAKLAQALGVDRSDLWPTKEARINAGAQSEEIAT